MFVHLQKKWAARYHQNLFNWHCKRFFPFDTHLTPSQREFLGFYLFDTQRHYPFMWTPDIQWPSLTYVHRSTSKHVNSSILLVGSSTPPAAVCLRSFKQIVESIASEAQVTLPPKWMEPTQYVFWGWGWDFLESSISTWWEVRELSALDALTRHFDWSGLEEHYPGLSAWVGLWYTSGQLTQMWIFLFPKVELECALLLRSRGIHLYRSDDTVEFFGSYASLGISMGQAKVSSAGRRVLSEYERKGMPIRKVASRDMNTFTFLFP